MTHIQISTTTPLWPIQIFAGLEVVHIYLLTDLHLALAILEIVDVRVGATDNVIHGINALALPHVGNTISCTHQLLHTNKS